MDGLNQLFWFTHSSIILLIPLPYPFPVKEAIICGMDNKEEAKITGMTFATFTLIGILDAWPPVRQITMMIPLKIDIFGIRSDFPKPYDMQTLSTNDNRLQSSG